jgi:hypothetical protein
MNKKKWIEKFNLKIIGRCDEGLKKWHRLELAGLWADCEDSKNFQSRFWWRYGMVKFIKIKKPKQRSLL